VAVSLKHSPKHIARLIQYKESEHKIDQKSSYDPRIGLAMFSIVIFRSINPILLTS